MIARTALLAFALAAALGGCGETQPAGASDGTTLVTESGQPAKAKPEPKATEVAVAPMLDPNGNEIDPADMEIIRAEIERQDAERAVTGDDWGAPMSDAAPEEG